MCFWDSCALCISCCIMHCVNASLQLYKEQCASQLDMQAGNSKYNNFLFHMQAGNSKYNNDDALL
jgi:epoxyqueuosine reductase QueG